MLHANVFYARSTSCRKTGSILFVEFISSIDVHLMTHLFSVKLSINIFLFYSFDSYSYSWVPTVITDITIIPHQHIHWSFFHSSFRKTHLFWFFPLYSLASSTDHKQGGQLHTLEREETWTVSLKPYSKNGFIFVQEYSMVNEKCPGEQSVSSIASCFSKARVCVTPNNGHLYHKSKSLHSTLQLG